MNRPLTGDERDTLVLNAAKLRTDAWRRILEAVDEMRDALDHRVWREDPDDTLLEADCQTWCELARALGDFLRARRSAR